MTAEITWKERDENTVIECIDYSEIICDGTILFLSRNKDGDMADIYVMLNMVYGFTIEGEHSNRCCSE